MDGLARQRRAEGLPGSSIGWGPWSEVGMAAALRDRDGQRHVESGVEPISPEDGARLFIRALRGSPPHVAVASIRWNRFLEAFAGRGVPPFFREFVERRAEPASRVSSAGPTLVQRLLALPPAEGRDLVVAHVRETALKVLGLKTSQSLPLRRPFSEMGLDSLMAVELRNALGAAFGVAFPASLPFEHPSVEELAQHLYERFAPSAPGGAAVGEIDPGRAAELLRALPDLPDAEVDALLGRMVAETRATGEGS